MSATRIITRATRLMLRAAEINAKAMVLLEEAAALDSGETAAPAKTSRVARTEKVARVARAPREDFAPAVGGFVKVVDTSGDRKVVVRGEVTHLTSKAIKVMNFKTDEEVRFVLGDDVAVFPARAPKEAEVEEAPAPKARRAAKAAPVAAPAKKVRKAKEVDLDDDLADFDEDEEVEALPKSRKVAAKAPPAKAVANGKKSGRALNDSDFPDL